MAIECKLFFGHNPENYAIGKPTSSSCRRIADLAHPVFLFLKMFVINFWNRICKIASGRIRKIFYRFHPAYLAGASPILLILFFLFSRCSLSIFEQDLQDRKRQDTQDILSVFILPILPAASPDLAHPVFLFIKMSVFIF